MLEPRYNRIMKVHYKMISIEGRKELSTKVWYFFFIWVIVYTYIPLNNTILEDLYDWNKISSNYLLFLLFEIYIEYGFMYVICVNVFITCKEYNKIKFLIELQFFVSLFCFFLVRNAKKKNFVENKTKQNKTIDWLLFESKIDSGSLLPIAIYLLFHIDSLSLKEGRTNKHTNIQTDRQRNTHQAANCLTICLYCSHSELFL